MSPGLRRTRLAAAALLMGVLAPILAAGDEPAGQQGSIWNLGSHPTGMRGATTVTAANVSCKGKRDFQIEVEGEARRFLEIVGPTRLNNIARGQSKDTPAVLDLNGVAPGVYNQGALLVRCLNCPASCRQDYTRIQIHLTVTGTPGGSAPGSATATGTGGGSTGGASGASSGTATAPGSADSTRTRKPCPEDTSPCDELRARADAAREAAAAARRALAEAERNQRFDEQDARWLDEDVARDRAQAGVLRRQAADWRRLAADAKADAAVNRDRANQWPEGHKYRKSWEDDAAADEARAAEREQKAQRLEDEAKKLEETFDERSQRAEDARTRVERLREQAEAAQRAADEAQRLYEDCLKRLREECERRHRQAELAELIRLTSSAPSAGSGGSGTSGGSPPGVEEAPPAFLPAYEAVPARLGRFCQWATYEIPREAFVSNVRLLASSQRDDTSAIEIRRTSAIGTRIGFQYHCVKKQGTAVVAFTQTWGQDSKRYKVRIGCTE